MEKMIRSLLRKKVNHMQFSEILQQPITAIIGVGSKEKITLSFIDIHSISDLASNPAFNKAFEKCYEIFGEEISIETQISPAIFTSKSNITNANEMLSLNQIPEMDVKTQERFKTHLNINNIIDMAQWGPYNIARYIANIMT